MQKPTAESTELDVAVVGAGPAGACAALELAGRGLRVGVIEKAVPPRYKTCGGGVLWRAVKRLPVDVRSVVERECRVAEIVHHDPALSFRCRRDYPIVSMVMRDRFDALLLESARQAGPVTLYAGTALTDLHIDATAVRLTTTKGDFRARYAIAADGVSSMVARKTGRLALRNVIPAVECEITVDPPAMKPLEDSARFDFGLIPAGYGWVFPKRQHLSIGVGAAHRGGPSLVDRYKQYLTVLGVGVVRHEERHGYMIPCRPRDGMFDVARVFFVGDAAGLADPITAEGITAGIVSGQLAAQSIAGHFADEAAARRRYESLLDDALLADLRAARWLAWLLYDRPRWFAFLLARHGQGMSELMARIVTGESTYRAAIRRPAHYLRLLAPRRPPA